MIENIFFHSNIPEECISPNIHVVKEYPHFPMRSGTGFFARRNSDIYYIIAKHCLKNLELSKISLKIPVSFNGYKRESNEYVTFEDVRTFEEQNEEEDLLVFPVKNKPNTKFFNTLFKRAAKLPPAGKWFQILLNALKTGGKEDMPFCFIGFPTENVEYFVTPDQLKVIAEQVPGYLSSKTSLQKNCFQLKIECGKDMDGFSGSPVFLNLTNKNEPQFILVGMVVRGSNNIIHVKRIDCICTCLDARLID